LHYGPYVWATDFAYESDYETYFTFHIIFSGQEFYANWIKKRKRSYLAVDVRLVIQRTRCKVKVPNLLIALPHYFTCNTK
jgi:hypothetical protein